MRIATAAALSALLLGAMALPLLAAPITYKDLLARERPAATMARIPYGADPLQFGELWLPEGQGPHPVVALIHGGCWRADLPGVELTAHMAEALRRDGIAVWNVEYRRIGGGGGYPATFQDVAAGLDHLRVLAPQHRLDLSRVVVSGHSAGGHLAAWAAARPKLPADSPLRTADPLTVKAVVSLAGIVDLAAYRTDGPTACGGPATIDGLTGAATGRTGDLYRDTSPAALLPLGVPQAVVSGALDKIVPSRFGEAYGAAAKTAGDRVEIIDFPGAGHFELIDPSSEAWKRLREVYRGLLK